MVKTKYLAITISCVYMFFFTIACKNEVPISSPAFEIRHFDPVSNWKQTDVPGVKTLAFDYTNALQGFVLPSTYQLSDGFKMVFEIKNTGTQPQAFYYKLYYQNETYKFQEQDEKSPSKQHRFASENFYGSWDDTNILFAKTPIIPNDNKFYKVEAYFRIVGNPRNEERYFSNGNNDRWKRNPRVGNYSFLLAVSTNDNIENNKIPLEVQDISLLQGNDFVNPYHYFLYGKGKNLSHTIAVLSEYQLKTFAIPEISNGVYFNPGLFSDKTQYEHINDYCNCTDALRQNAAFEQFIHYVDESSRFNNIPLIKDVLVDNYSLKDYNWHKTFFKKEELVSTKPQTSVKPCQNVYYDKEKNVIMLRNPKSTYGNWKKENAGVMTRHNFTYGTYTLKANLTRLLNDKNVWNGIVNTMWLLNASNDEWNKRRICSKEGYLATYWGGPQDKRVPYVSYSEIDFEILKTVSYCPPYKFPPAYLPSKRNRFNIGDWYKPLPDELEAEKDKIIVACTNWDMACWEPENFSVGCHALEYEGKTFLNHRWDHWYRAITQKTPELDKELFGNTYYFQIEWKPEEIIWRIGNDKNNLRVVGYMNSTVTSIPNNQMFLIITQEFHNTKWWVGAPFHQEFIPFPKNDIKGHIYEITIE